MPQIEANKIDHSNTPGPFSTFFLFLFNNKFGFIKPIRYLYRFPPLSYSSPYTVFNVGFKKKYGERHKEKY